MECSHIYPFPKDPSNSFVGYYFFLYICNMDENKLYSEIEKAIILWNNNGTKTAGTLTREIMELIKKYQNGN